MRSGGHSSCTAAELSAATELLQTILKEQDLAEGEARAVLSAALLAEVDPLEYCVHRFGLSPTLAMARAAQWAGLAYAEDVPALVVRDSAQPRRLDALAAVRTLRGRLYGRDVIFGAPTFTALLRLKQRAAEDDRFRRQFCVVPAAAIRRQLTRASESELTDLARQRLSRRWPHASAPVDLTFGRRLAFVLLLCGLLVAAAVGPHWLEMLFLPLLAPVLLGPSLLRLWAALAPAPPTPAPAPLAEEDLPIYSILLPLRDEAAMVPQLARSLRALDYPAEKLDIKFVVEATSLATRQRAEAELHDARFELVLVPDSLPSTKPKAMNFALPLVRGELLAIYDAEDIPDPGQLRLAAARFAERPDLDCLQAELVVDNAGENALTALFAGEYAGQFGLVLPLLARLGLPMPLGGTSNHFRVSALREVGGWDAFNVTEDADLGVRLARLRYRTGTIASRTGEEAPVTPDAFLRQRTRWMKGWMQTFIVHNSRPGKFLEDIGWRGFVAFQIYVGSLIVSAPLHTVFMASLLLGGLLPQPGWDVWDAVSVAMAAAGYSGGVALSFSGLSRLGERRLLGWQVLLPFYWMLHSVAAMRAVWELLTRPYFWAKTRHGRTRLARPARGTAGSAIAAEVEVGDVDLGNAAGDHVGHHSAGPGRHGPAQRAVTGVQVEPLER